MQFVGRRKRNAWVCYAVNKMQLTYLLTYLLNVVVSFARTRSRALGLNETEFVIAKRIART